MKLASILTATFALSVVGAHSQAPDNGVPASEAAEWRDVYNPTTGSRWRTKTNSETGETVRYNPFTTEIWRNPVSGQAESVLREDWINDGFKEAKQTAAKLLSAQSSNDNGIPTSAAREFTEVSTPTTGGETKTVKNSTTGQVIQYNRKTEELWKNPNTGKYEAVQREPSQTSQWDGFDQKLIDAYNAGAGKYGTAGSSSSGAAPTPQSKPLSQDPGEKWEIRSGNFKTYSTGTGHQGDPIRTYRVEDPAPARQVPPSAPKTYVPSYTPYVPPAPRTYTPPAPYVPPAPRTYTPPAPYVPPAPVYRPYVPNTSR